MAALGLCVFLENKIARHYSFGTFQKLQMHALTAALIVYHGLLSWNKLTQGQGSAKSAAEVAAKEER